MSKLIVNESINIKTVGELKKVLNKYNNDRELEIVTQAGIEEIVNFACNNNKITIKTRLDNVIDISKYKPTPCIIEEIHQGDMHDNVIDISSLLQGIDSEDTAIDLNLKEALNFFKNLFPYDDLEI